jgi:methionyl-tRNA formyltransferase
VSAGARIVFIGAERVGLACLERLLSMGRNVVGAFTAHDDLRPRIADFVCFPDLGVPVYPVKSSKAPETVAAIKALRPDLIVVVSWSQIIPPEIIEAAPRGCVGIHYSLLPARRGGAPLNWAILDGLTESGITLYYIDEGIDSGDIVAQKSFPIDRRDTVKDLLDKVLSLAPELVAENVIALEQGTALRARQDESIASFTRPRTPRDGEIDWAKSLPELDRLIRALAPPYPCAFSPLGGGRRLVIESARLTDGDNQLNITGYIE